MKWYAGSDHAGYRLKRYLIDRLRSYEEEVIDLGTDSEESCDYPDFAARVGRRVAADEGSMGLLVCGTGNGIAMAANKIPGVRCAVVTGVYTAQAARAHNNANVIAIGSRVIGRGVADQALNVFRMTPFEGGRHQRRVDRLMALDRVRDSEE